MLSSTQDLPGAAILADRGSIRRGEVTDAIAGVIPTLVIEPDGGEALADMLAWASRERRSTVIRGGGTKLTWGNAPASIDVVLSTIRLNRVLTHAHGDLTATIEAGADIASVNQSLARHRQFLALDTPFDGATIGGTIATNDSGSLRHRYGTPRDLLIGVHLATTDGRLVKAGGNVVKNVAGYDLGKLVSGSFGTLAAIVSATFKLTPIPPSSKTLVAHFAAPEGAAAASAALAASQIEPAAFDLHVMTRRGATPTCQLLLRFTSTPEAIASGIQQVRSLVAADRVEEMAAEQEEELWRGLARAPWSGAGAVVKMSWLPASMPGVLRLVGEISNAGAAIELVGRAAIGAGFVRIDADSSAQVVAIKRLRDADLVGNVVVLKAASDVKEQAGAWPPSGDNTNVLRAIKRAFDPAGVLNAGRGYI